MVGRKFHRGLDCTGTQKACKVHNPKFELQCCSCACYESLGTTRNTATACVARMAARYDLRSKQARLHASAAGCSWQKKPKPPDNEQVAGFGVLPIALLQPIFAQVLFLQKMKCEAVCRAWRSVLRSADTTTFISSAAGVWDTSAIISTSTLSGRTSRRPPHSQFTATRLAVQASASVKHLIQICRLKLTLQNGYG